LSVNLYLEPHYETLFIHPLQDLAMAIPLYRQILIQHRLVSTDIWVKGLDAVTIGELSKVQYELTTGVLLAMVADLTRVCPKSRSYNSNMALQLV